MTTTEPVSMRYTHALKAYELMFSEARQRKADDGAPMLVWEGFLTRLIKDQLGLATPYYTDIKKILSSDGMNCIRQLRRGGSSTPSQWELLREPTEELWKVFLEKRPKTKRDVLEQRVADLNTRLTAIENVLRNGGISIQ